MVQSLGISVGNANSYVAAGQGGGIELLLNEYSNRSTPSMVAFNDECRAMGMDASSNLFMNFKNTIYDLMVLLGKPYKDLQLEDANGRPLYSFKIEEGPNGEALVVVRHLGQERKFTITQVLAMLFTKLRGIAHDATDCVLSCPQFYNDTQKAALMQAALVSGLKPLQIITDMSAVILNYAYYRTTKEDTHKFIALVNIGQSNLQSVIAWFTPKEDAVRILAAESEPIGGRDFDRCLAEHFIKTHQLSLTPKSYLKLVSACEKLKRLLSANANEIPINVESLISEDKDFTARIDRAAFEELGQPILQRIESCLRRTLENAQATFAKMMAETAEGAKAAEVARAAEATKAVELAKKAEAAKAKKAAVAAKVAEEAKAAAAAAKQAQEESKKEAAAVEQEANGDSAAPATEQGGEKPNSANNKETPMEAESEELTKATNEETKAIQAAKDAKAAEKSMSSQANKLTKLAQLKFELQVVEMVGGSIRVPSIKQLTQNVFNLTPSTTLNTDEAVARGCVLHCATLHPGMKVKREVKIFNSESVEFNKPSSLTCDKDLRRIELELVQQDRKYRSRTEARNTLEEYIYTERSKLQEGDQFLQQLSEALEWLSSDEGEEASEEVYNIKLAELKSISEARLTEAKKSEEKKVEAQQQANNNVEAPKS